MITVEHKIRNSVSTTTGILLGVSGVGLTGDVGVLNDTAFQYIGIAGILASPVALLTWLPVFDVSKIVHTVHDTRIMKRSELREMHKLAEYSLPECPSLSQTKSDYDKQPEGFLVVERYMRLLSYKINSIVGFVTMVALTMEGVKNLQNGKRINRSYMANSFKDKRAKGVYIGSISATSIRSKAEALGFLKAKITAHAENGLKHVFTRPITKDGLRLVDSYNFSPVDKNIDNKIGEVYYKKVNPSSGLHD